MTDQAKDKQDIEAEEMLHRVKISWWAKSVDPYDALTTIIAAKLRERDAALERADAIILRYEIDLTACQRQLAAANGEIERLKALIRITEDYWLSLSPGVPWEGAIDEAMKAAVKEIERLRFINRSQETEK